MEATTKGLSVGTQAMKIPRPAIHWFATALMAAAIGPLYRLAGLPLGMDLAGMATTYWCVFSFQAVFLATLLYVVDRPINQTLLPVTERYRQQKLRVPLLMLVLICLSFRFAWSTVGMLAIDMIALAELLDRGPVRFGKRTLDVLIPAGYLFFGLLLVFALNHAIAGMKFAAAWDPIFDHLDRRMFGVTVSEIADWSSGHLPQWTWRLASFTYYSLFGEVGAVLIITALAAGRYEAFRYAGAILTAYFGALICFYLMPTIGPFALRTVDSTNWGWLTQIYQGQRVLVVYAGLVWHHVPVPGLSRVQSAEYYIGFPSMHVAMSTIALWFMRRSRAALAALMVFNVWLLAGIILLECHYILDILGGIGIAAIAIALNRKK
jgi:PAP2 superfamily protein